MYAAADHLEVTSEPVARAPCWSRLIFPADGECGLRLSRSRSRPRRPGLPDPDIRRTCLAFRDPGPSSEPRPALPYGTLTAQL